MFEKLDENQAQELLSGESLGRLGCIFEGEPYVVPINYYYENGFAYSHSLPGQKIIALRANPKACLQVDRVESDLRWLSVLAFGQYEEVVDTDERDKVLGKLLNRFPRLTPVESVIADDAGPPPAVIVFRLRIERITGLSEG